MTTPRAIELAVALLLFAAGVVIYRRRDRSDSYGSQGAVILLVVATIVAIHALSLMDYHPTQAEADMLRSRAQ
ncbi:MAG TPA: hypothetical protein VIK68_04685 [Sphingomicrobium sp.]